MTAINNTFSMERFMSLMKKYIIENWKVMLMRLLLMVGTLTVISCCIAVSNFSDYEACLNPDNSNHIHNTNASISAVIAGSMIMCLFIFGCMHASMTMESLKSKPGRIATFMTPASQLEKYLVRWIIAVPGFIILFIAGCEIADLTRCALTLLIHPEYSSLVSPINWYELTHYIYKDETVVHTGTYLTIYSFLVLQSFFVLGSAIWPRNSLLKTFVALIVLNTVYSLVLVFGAHLMDGRHFDWENVKTVGTFIEESIYLIWGVAVLVMITFNYVLAYFRLKEMEIINRM